MIDWAWVSAQTLWILGVATIAAAGAYHDWLAQRTGQRRRDLLRQPSWRLPLSAGMLMACAGVAMSSNLAAWQRLLSGALVLPFVLQLARSRRGTRRPTGGPR